MAISLQKHKGIELRRRRQTFHANANKYDSTSSKKSIKKFNWVFLFGK